MQPSCDEHAVVECDGLAETTIRAAIEPLSHGDMAVSLGHYPHESQGLWPGDRHDCRAPVWTLIQHVEISGSVDQAHADDPGDDQDRRPKQDAREHPDHETSLGRAEH